MVLVGVGGDYDVEAGDASAPEVGGDYVFPGVEGRGAGVAVLEVAAAVDQHFQAVGEDQEEAVALAYVDGG